MRYRILAIGRLKRGFAHDGCEHYRERLRPFGRIDVVEIKEARGDAGAVREAESAALIAASQGHSVCLDESGRNFDTRGLAARLAELELRGISQLSLLIGGAEGHAPWLRERCDESWSLSPLTLPHELARLVLLEQLYRVESLRAGHPYHRD